MFSQSLIIFTEKSIDKSISLFSFKNITSANIITYFITKLFHIRQHTSLVPQGTNFIEKTTCRNKSFFWPARRDSNPRSSESESAALSSCATSGNIKFRNDKVSLNGTPYQINIIRYILEDYSIANAMYLRTFRRYRILLPNPAFHELYRVEHILHQGLPDGEDR